MNVHDDKLSGCVDCLCYVANGDIPVDRPNLPELITKRYPGLHVVPACTDECEGWFAWSWCDICGDHDGGERHPFAVLCSHDECKGA